MASFGDGAVTDVGRHEAPGHDPAAYVSEIRTFPAPDGHLVPATIVRHHDTPLDGTAPALVYGYGSYEAVFEPEWEEPLPSLLDRGVVYVHTHRARAVARVAGGGGWTDGCTRSRTPSPTTSRSPTASRHAASSTPTGSRRADSHAGGLLQGAVFSQRPDRWRAVVAEVPFVDVVTTMLDDTIPLTVTEWDEWGDPHVRAEFDAMLAYSPVENLPPAGSRPDLLVTGAVHDARVMVREPAKWVAAAPRVRPGLVASAACSASRPAPAPTSVPAGGSATSSYEAEVSPGSSTASASSRPTQAR